MIQNLKAKTNYTFYVRSYITSASEKSAQVTCITGKISLLLLLYWFTRNLFVGVTGNRNIYLRKAENNSLLVTWSKISSDTPCGSNNTEYKLHWKKDDKIASSVLTVNGYTHVLSGTTYFKSSKQKLVFRH